MCNRSVSDESLVKVILDGDKNAFTQLHDRYKLQIYSVTYRIIQNYEGAQDAAQEIFIKLYQSLHQWDPEKSRLSTWIHRLAVNHSIDCCRLRFRRAESQLMENNAEQIFRLRPTGSYARSPYKAIKNKEELKLVRDCIEKLPDLQKKTFTRRYFQEMKLVEIAEMECRNLGTVKSSLYRATHTVRKILLQSRGFSLRKMELRA